MSAHARATSVRHRLDGGASHAIRDTLEPLLEEIRASLGADAALAVFRSRGGYAVRVLAASAVPSLELPLASEPLGLNVRLPARSPVTWQDVVLASTVRAYRLELSTALAVPWRDASGAGALIVGMTPGSYNSGALDLETARTYGPRLREAHRDGGIAGTLRLQGDLNSAIRVVAETTLAETNVSAILEAIAMAARTLLATSAAYISLPEDDPDYFQFHTLLNIRTRPFRRLRVRYGEGLGGLTREHLKTVRSINYANDTQLRHAPVLETAREGILSAMCTPLVTDGKAIGLLYVANRKMTPFTETDVALIEEFAGYATLGMRHSQLEEHRREVMRRREQERLAAQLHDSVMRSLMEIGFQAEQGIDGPVADDELQARFGVIARAAESCLETLRGHIAELTSGAMRHASLDDLLEVVRLHDWGSYGGSAAIECSCPTPGVRVGEHLSEAITRIAREAIENAKLHSGARTIDVSLEARDREVRLVVADDGRGMAAEEITRVLCEDVRHFGLRGMRAAAKQVGGHLSLSPGRQGGLVVEAVLPLERSRERG